MDPGYLCQVAQHRVPLSHGQDAESLSLSALSLSRGLSSSCLPLRHQRQGGARGGGGGEGEEGLSCTAKPLFRFIPAQPPQAPPQGTEAQATEVTHSSPYPHYQIHTNIQTYLFAWHELIEIGRQSCGLSAPQSEEGGCSERQGRDMA